MSDEEVLADLALNSEENDEEDSLSGIDLLLDEAEEGDAEVSESEEEATSASVKKKRKVTKNAFIDDEAELSGDDVGSEDEVDESDADEEDLDLVDKEAAELDSDQEEEVRGFYHKQLESEDKRAVLLLKEHLEDHQIAAGQRRRRKFRWQTKNTSENSLKRHYDPDDDDSQQDDDDDDDFQDYSEVKPRLSRLALKQSSILARYGNDDDDDFSPFDTQDSSHLPSTSGVSKSLVTGVSRTAGFSDDSNSNTISKLASKATASANSNINKFVFRDKELVEALSTKEVVLLSREERERVVEREVRRVLQSKSIFDQLYG